MSVTCEKNVTSSFGLKLDNVCLLIVDSGRHLVVNSVTVTGRDLQNDACRPIAS